MKRAFQFPTLCYIFLVLTSCIDIASGDIATADDTTEIIHSRQADFRLELVAAGMRVPWSMDWLPDGRALISDRKAGQIYLLNPGDTAKTALCNAPQAFTYQDSGMREILVSPNYEQDGWVYISYDTSRADSMSTLMIIRAKIEGHCLVQREVPLRGPTLV